VNRPHEIDDALLAGRLPDEIPRRGGVEGRLCQQRNGERDRDESMIDGRWLLSNS